MIRVLVVDDHAIVRMAIRRLIDAEPDMQVVGQSDTGRDATRLCVALTPDVAVLDMNLPQLDVLSTTQRIVRECPGTRVVVQGFYAHHEYLARLVRAGATGFVTKSASPDLLLEAIRKSVGGGCYVEPAMMEQLLGEATGREADMAEAQLSNRELQVLGLLACGCETREVAASLQLSRSTVETHRSRILRKLGLRNNAELTRFAIRRGLVHAP